jgi:nitric oxide dioxygenase
MLSPASIAVVRHTPPAAAAAIPDITRPFHETVFAEHGNVVVDTGRWPLLLASAGSGCAPIIRILEHLAVTSSERQVTVVHADRSAATHALRRELYRSVSQLINARARIWYEQPHRGWPAEYTGFADLSKIDVTSDMYAYICGPMAFVESIRQQLLDRGVPVNAIRQELFDAELAA